MALFRIAAMLLTALLLLSCKHTDAGSTLYEELGGRSGINQIVDNFITEIEYSPDIFPYFENSDVARFHEKLSEHICMLASGPCAYTGDTMEQVHAGMNISERDFNIGVDLLINAMNKANIPHTTQNKLLATMTPTRKEIIYK
ncbi:group 1 truncated hemoglobin [Glaciecola siphonariae]|uniref:Group 1 truncated hemoglobin n=1 Tax=Glaciecola siphonariae TaxID=521012 RepID=A0ABV9LZD7_9ALTE